MIKFRHRGNFEKTERFLKGSQKLNYKGIASRYGTEGISALKRDTPVDTGNTADSWAFEVVPQRNGFKIVWTNSNLVDGIPIVILLQYGHGTRSGTFVEGRDFINPAMRPIFDKIAANLWKEVSSL